MCKLKKSGNYKERGLAVLYGYVLFPFLIQFLHKK